MHGFSELPGCSRPFRFGCISTIGCHGKGSWRSLPLADREAWPNVVYVWLLETSELRFETRVWLELVFSGWVYT